MDQNNSNNKINTNQQINEMHKQSPKKENPEKNKEIIIEPNLEQDDEQELDEFNTKKVFENAQTIDANETASFLVSAEKLFGNKILRHFFQHLFFWLKFFGVFHSCYLHKKNGKIWKFLRNLYRFLIIILLLWSMGGSAFSFIDSIRKKGEGMESRTFVPGFWEVTLNNTITSFGAVFMCTIPFASWVFCYRFFRKPHFNRLLKNFFTCPINGPRLAKKVRKYMLFIIVYPIVATGVSLTINYSQPDLKEQISKQKHLFVADLLLTIIAYWFQFGIVTLASILILFLCELHLLRLRAFLEMFLDPETPTGSLMDMHMDMQQEIEKTAESFETYIAYATGAFGVGTLLLIYAVFAIPKLVGFRFIYVLLYLVLVFSMLWSPAKVTSSASSLASKITSTHVAQNFSHEKVNELTLFHTYIQSWKPNSGFQIFDITISKSLITKLLYMVFSLVLILVQKQLMDFGF
ncbi:ras guanine nucleotide exchange factor k [Anaeramoeba ignava]|uniref:Ras guanine nucleotide exchange factor k n=1 Tax=Anaeramoeba ignava TaxID=1746090 RepID=A0A9Q0LA99_ANAIG|nr:ras guanine nucleotide exchange factor k [Anaeramoeba ignava]